MILIGRLQVWTVFSFDLKEDYFSNSKEVLTIIKEGMKDRLELKDEVPDARKWLSMFSLFRNRGDQKALDLFPGIELYLSPSRKTWISIRYIPQSALKTSLQVDLHTSLPKDHPSITVLESRLRVHFQCRVRQLAEMQSNLDHKCISQQDCKYAIS